MVALEVQKQTGKICLACVVNEVLFNSLYKVVVIFENE